MSQTQSPLGSSAPLGADLNPEQGFHQTFEGGGDPVEAYFECITQCSLDDGECITVCTTILKES
jgi:hypothetical protein